MHLILSLDVFTNTACALGDTIACQNFALGYSEPLKRHLSTMNMSCYHFLRVNITPLVDLPISLQMRH